MSLVQQIVGWVVVVDVDVDVDGGVSDHGQRGLALFQRAAEPGIIVIYES